MASTSGTARLPARISGTNRRAAAATTPPLDTVATEGDEPMGRHAEQLDADEERGEMRGRREHRGAERSQADQRVELLGRRGEVRAGSGAHEPLAGVSLTRGEARKRQEHRGGRG